MSATSTSKQSEEAKAEPEILSVPADLENIVATKVADALAAVLPGLVSQLTGGGPTQAVEVTPAEVVRQNPFGHYRKDGVKVGKHIEFDMDLIEQGIEPAYAVKKGSWVIFTSGHCYPESSNQQRQLDWMIATDPFCGIYRDEGGSVLPCPVANCPEFFSNQAGLQAHLAATHGVR